MILKNKGTSLIFQKKKNEEFEKIRQIINFTNSENLVQNTISDDTFSVFLTATPPS